MVKLVTKVIDLDELLEYYLGEVEGMVDLDIIKVLNEGGDTLYFTESLEVVYQMAIDDGVDEDEPTPEEQNDELRSLGF